MKRLSLVLVVAVGMLAFAGCSTTSPTTPPLAPVVAPSTNQSGLYFPPVIYSEHGATWLNNQ